MTITKSISFFAPYIVNELNTQVDNIAGGDALLYGGEITVQTSTTVDIAPYIFMQGGVTVFQDAVTVGVVVPDFSVFTGPVHILVASPDAKNTSGVTISVAEGNESVDENAIVLASRTQNAWSNPHKPSLIELRKDALSARADASGGRISDASVEFDDGQKGWGTNQGFHLKQGEVADSAGAKTILGVDTSLGEPNSSLEFDLTSVDQDFPRSDYIVARRVSDNLNVPPEIVYAKGETLSVNNTYIEETAFSGGRIVFSDPVNDNTKPSVAYNAAGQYVVVHGNTTNLYHTRLDHAPTRPIDAGPTAVAAGGTVTDVFLAERKDVQTGDRLYGCCIVGTEVAIFRTTADGASIGAPDISIFTSMPNTPAKPHMVVTGEGTTENPLYAHIFFHHFEGASNNQIYYTKYALADATWGTAPAIAIAPVIARGFNSGADHTDPHAAVHPNGNLHVAYVHTSIKSEIRYLVINQAGEVVEVEQALATGTGEVNDGTGTGITIDDNCQEPRVVISPQGSVYVVWADISKAVLADEGLIAWDPTMFERTGFHATVIYSGFNTEGWHYYDAFSDDLGNLCCLASVNKAGDTDEVTAYWLKFNPVLVGDGRTIAPDSHNTDLDTGLIDTIFYSDSTVVEGEAILDRDGSLSIVNVENAAEDILHHKLSSMSVADTFADKKKTHPRDEYLARIAIPSGTSDTITSAADAMVHPTRIKSLPPITVVGLDGQKGSFTGLQEAIWSLRGIGGRIIIKGGEYIFRHPIEVVSGIEIIGDGHVVLVQSGYNIGLTCNSLNYLTAAVIDAPSTARKIFSVSGGGNSNLLQFARVGDVGFVWDWTTRPLDDRSEFSQPFVITKILDGSTFQTNRDISGEIDANKRVSIYSTGVKLQNLTLYDDRAAGTSDELIKIEPTYMGVFKDLHVIQTQGVSPVIEVQGVYGTRFENLVVDKAASNSCFDLIEYNIEVHNFDVTLSHCAFRGDAELTKFVGLKVDSCLAENWTVTGTVNEVPVWTNNAGAISATSFDSAASWADDASTFVHRLVLNEDATLLGNGNVRGSLTPTATGKNVGTTTKKWQEMVAETLHGSPTTGNIGLRLDASNLSNFQDDLSEVYDWDGDLINVQDSLGQWVGTNKFEDDFLYLSNKVWVSNGVPATSQFPDDTYEFFPSSVSGTSPDIQIDSGALIPDAIEFDGAGIIVSQIANTDSFTAVGPSGFAAGWLATDQRIVFKIKHSFGYPSGGNVIEAFQHRTDRFGLRDINGNHEIYIEYLNTTGTAPYPIINLVIDDKTNPVSKTNLPNSTILMDTWRIYYIVVEDTQVRAWADGASFEAVKAFAPGAPGPNAPGTIVKYQPFWFMDTDGSATENKFCYIDHWCVFNNSLLK